VNFEHTSPTRNSFFAFTVVAGSAAFFAHSAPYDRSLHSRAVVHIVFCIRGQLFRLRPIGSSVPWQLAHLCSGHNKHSAFVGCAAAFAASLRE
jgi:hypothetical protein